MFAGKIARKQYTESSSDTEDDDGTVHLGLLPPCSRGRSALPSTPVRRPIPLVLVSMFHAFVLRLPYRASISQRNFH